jgi:hypothetical protein
MVLRISIFHIMKCKLRILKNAKKSGEQAPRLHRNDLFSGYSAWSHCSSAITRLQSGGKAGLSSERF